MVKETGVQCQYCKSKNATHTRQNTQYVDDNENYKTLCPECQIEEDEYWRGMWADYYSGCM